MKDFSTSKIAKHRRKKRLQFRTDNNISEVRKVWSAEDTASLILHYELFGPKWKLIAKSVGRTPDGIRNRFQRLVEVCGDFYDEFYDLETFPFEQDVLT